MVTFEGLIARTRFVKQIQAMLRTLEEKLGTAVDIAQEFARGVAIRKRNTGQSLGSALIGMVLRGKRRYGGYLVHIGIMLMFFGWAGSAYQIEKTAKLAPDRPRPSAPTPSGSTSSRTRKTGRKRW